MEFGAKPFRLTPMDPDLAMLAAAASLPESRHSSSSDIRPCESLFNLTAGFDDPISQFETAISTINFEENMSVSMPLPDCTPVPDLIQEDSVSTPRHSHSSKNHPTTFYDVDASDVALLDSIVDFFESFGVGFCSSNPGEDTFGMDSPAKDGPISKTCVSREQNAKAAEPA